MMQAVSMGVDSVLVLAGDPCMECSKQPDLLSRIRTLKHEPYSSLMVGAAADPNLMDIGRLKDKRDAGADFFITQPVFDKSTLIGYLEATRSLEVPSFIGIMVPHSRAQMDSLNRITGVKITDEYLANFAGIQNEGAFSAIAVAKAIELIKLCRDLGCSGVYVSVAPSQIRYLKELVNNGE
jgi:5,10-methylenetetrahydrofolate reductase